MFQRIQDKHLQEGTLFEDPDFPAIGRSIYYSKTDPTIQWHRPGELVKHPSYFVGRVNRFDLDQGALGNCWFVAAAATLACNKKLFARVVPSDQSFDKNYAGVFRFYFWRYGKWVEVVIDDRLPTKHGRLCFCKNREEPDEFWSALFEKAYAKLHGSYEALHGGWTEDALVDFTGGVGERLDLKSKVDLPSKPFKMLHDTHKMHTLMGCSIKASKENMEKQLPNGLVIGHAYSITKVLKVKINDNLHRLLRLRNPWGRREWNGPWSDGSEEWLSVPDVYRKEMGLVFDEDGEFWMPFQDWLENFEQLQMCHLPPSEKEEDHEEWHELVHHGSWVRGVSAGGCGNTGNDYWTNPQFSVRVLEPDTESPDGRCTLIVSLMQKYGRLLRTHLKADMTNAALGFDVYRLKEDVDDSLDGSNYDKYSLQLARRSGKYTYYREVTQRFRLEPGNYVIIPSTFRPGVEYDFLLRLYTPKNAESRERDIPTAPILKPTTPRDVLLELFSRHAGKDGVVDARELKDILNELFYQELGSRNAFELEACRSLLAMMDLDRSGVLEFEEVRRMWSELTTWRGVFHMFDRDNSGFIETKELRSVFKSIGYTLSKRVLKSIVRRYGGKDGRLSFTDFIMCTSKVVAMFDVFSSYSKHGLKGKAEFSLEEWMETSLYF